MEGWLINKNNTWFVKYQENSLDMTTEELPLYQKDVDDNLLQLQNAKLVEFKIIDEFTNPELYKGIPIFEGQKIAKLIKI